MLADKKHELSLNSLDETRYALFLNILDEIIPAGGVRRMPSAGMKAVADSVLSATACSSGPAGSAFKITDAVSARTDCFADLGADARVSLLKEVEADLPHDFSAIVRQTYMAYYSAPIIRQLLGVGAHPVHPEGYPVERESKALMDELTAPVRARGQAYRKADQGSSQT